MRHQTKSLILILASFLMGLPISSATPAQEAESILKEIDNNRVSGNKIVLSEMIIHGRRGSRSVKAKSWIQGTEKSFSEYLDPPRERGTKMLKLNDQLWTYYPASDRIILISGHMLRQSVLGSDLSYEDMMEDPRLSGNYEAVINGEETILDRPCLLLDLTSKREDAAYYRRRIWVDKERFTILREERYARSGKLLKTADVKSVLRVKERWIPERIVFKDVMNEGEGTEFHILNIEFDAAIPPALFSKASLKE